MNITANTGIAQMGRREIMSLKGIIICGFPGIGKTSAESVCREAIDCESSGFHYIFDPTGVEKENPNWVSEYVNFIEKCAKDGKYRFVLASTHLKVREELDMRMIPYIVVVPRKNLKDEYLARYVKRGDCAEFIIEVSESWNEWLDEVEENAPAIIHLETGQVLSDILPIPQLRGKMEGGQDDV